MDNYVITVARQYGSGGRTVGEMLANDLGIHYYDKELIRIASEDSGIHERLFAKNDEAVTNFLRFNPFKKGKQGQVLPPNDGDFTSDVNLYNLQAETIKQLATHESCVIIGRCANYILKDMPNVISVFVHAGEDFRFEQAQKKLSLSPKEIEQFMKKDDKRKADYYKFYTGMEWTDARNYELCLDGGRLGFVRCVEEIKSYMKIRFQK